MSSENPPPPLEFTPPSLEQISELLPGYSFKRLIATGGMGAVYEASQISLDRPVAIKILPPELGESESFRASFEKEAKLMARLNHPNLIGVYDFGDIEGMLYIVMEFVDGASLYEKACDTILGQREALKITLGICNGLANAHEAGILHRDIKPANIFITENGTPKIGDFGLARPSGDHETGVIFGTPGYAAPEVTNAPEQVGPATDIFAVGVTLYELLTAKVPDVAYQPVNRCNVNCDPSIDRMVRKAISAQPQQRYQSAECFAEELEELLRKLKKKEAVASKFNTAATAQSPQTSALNTGTATAKPLQTPGLGSATAAVRPSTVKPLPKKKSGGAFKNILIVSVLLAAIYFTLQWKKDKEAKIAAREAENKATPEKIYVKKPGANNAAVSKVRKPKSPKDQLLKQLTTGENALKRIPKETVTLEKGSRLVAFVDKNLTWSQADRWCSERGGYLVVLDTIEDTESVSPLIPSGKEAWIGAASAGKKRWSWIDGSPWGSYPYLPKTSKLAYAQLDKEQTIRAKRSSAQSSFLIEWRLNGDEPADLKQRMLRVTESIANKAAIFPPGSITNGKRHYYLCPIPMTLEEAKEAADEAGAQIATPSNAEELNYFKTFIPQHIPAGKLCRIGGEFDGDDWIWISGEPWELTHWAPGHPKNQESLAVSGQNNGPWKDTDSYDTLPYTLFEWSTDKVASSAKQAQMSKQRRADNKKANAALSEFQSKAATLVKKEITKRDALLTKNITRFNRTVRLHRRSSGNVQREEESAYLEALVTKATENNRVSIDPNSNEPTPLERFKNGEDVEFEEGDYKNPPSRKIAKIIADAVKKEAEIDASYSASISKIRTRYQSKMKTLITGFEKQKLTKVVSKAKSDLRKSNKSSQSFVKSLL